MTAIKPSWRAWPLAVLWVEVLAFFRHILFYNHYAIPWDFRYYHLSQAWFMARSLARGELPLWDPFSYCGIPIYANLTMQLFYPPTLAAVYLSNWTGGRHLLYFLEWQLVAHVLLAGALAYWLLRRLGAGRAAAVAGATVYQLGAYMASQTQHLGAIDTAAWLPLAWLAVLSLAGRFEWRWLAALILAFVMSILAGFPAAAAVVFATSFLLAAILASPRGLAYVVLAAVWSILLSAVQLLPTLQLSRLSVANLRSHFLGSGGGMPWQALVSLITPNHYGIFQFEGSDWKLPWDVTFLYTYCGILPLLLIALALATRRHRLTIAFALLTLCAALWMLGDSTPIGKTIFLLLPDAVKGSLYAQFALCAFTLGMAVLAGLGAHQLLASRALWLQAAVVTLVALDLIAVSSGRPMNTVDERVDPGIAYDHFDRYPEIPTAIRRLVNQNVPPWRVDIMRGYHDMVSAAPLFEYPSANGDDPFALVRLMQVRSLFTKGVAWGRHYQVSDPDSPLLKLLNVRYILSSGLLPNPGSLAKIAELPGTVIYENPGVLPRFFLAGGIRLAAGTQDALAILRSPDFDPRREAVVENAWTVYTGSSRVDGTVQVIEYGARQFILEVNASAPSFLVTSESAYPGWHAWLDGQPSTPLLTNVAFRGLSLPAGKHLVKMRFDPEILWYGMAITLASFCGLALAVWFGDNKQAKGRWISKTS